MSADDFALAEFLQFPRVSVVVPAKNEARNLAHVFATIPSWVDEIVFVDGRSTDDSVAVVRDICPAAKIIVQEGWGKGEALRLGFAACTGDIIVMMDADGSTDGGEIARFVGALVTGADFVKGSRFASGGGSDDITFERSLGNFILSRLVNVLFGTQYTDLCYGYNAMWARHLPQLNLDCDGFEVETVLNVRAAKAGLVVHEVPSHEHQRLHGASNLRVMRDGWRIAKVIMREWASGRRRSATAVTAPDASGSAVASGPAVPTAPDESVVPSPAGEALASAQTADSAAQ